MRSSSVVTVALIRFVVLRIGAELPGGQRPHPARRSSSTDPSRCQAEVSETLQADPGADGVAWRRRMVMNTRSFSVKVHPFRFIVHQQADGPGLLFAPVSSNSMSVTLVLSWKRTPCPSGCGSWAGSCLVLVVPGKAQRPPDRAGRLHGGCSTLDKTHFQCAVPVLKGEHGAPVKPEVGREHFRVKDIGDALIIELLIRVKKSLMSSMQP